MSQRDPRARIEALDAVIGALGHPARRQILLTIHFRRGAMTAGDIARRFAHSWPTTTRHLRVLENAGLLRQTKEGRTRTYHLERSRLAILEEWLGWFDHDPNAA